jgi:succinate dehydrogenase / fumarate reductase cytochrome b subunit
MNAITRSLVITWQSSIGKKLLVALSGAFLLLFLLGHLAGNLLVYAGREAFNDYAELLHHMLHGAGIWVFRAVMLAAVAIHVAATVALTRQNRAAREGYQMEGTIQATRSSRIMIWSGLTVLAFLVYHLLHFTVRIGNEYDSYVDPLHLAATGLERQDAWRMVIDGFSWWPASLFYIIAMTLLCSHASHGVQSMFQTLGLRSAKSAATLDLVSKGYAAVVWIGFVSIPVSILLFGFGR